MIACKVATLHWSRRQFGMTTSTRELASPDEQTTAGPVQLVEDESGDVAEGESVAEASEGEFAGGLLLLQPAAYAIATIGRLPRKRAKEERRQVVIKVSMSTHRCEPLVARERL